MTVTNYFETGSPEAVCKTIGKWFSDKWAASNPTVTIPEMRYEATGKTHNWPAKTDKDQIHFNDGKSGAYKKSPSGLSSKRRWSEVIITMFAEDMTTAEKYAEKLNNIILDNFPNQGTRILKTDGASVSKIATFETEQIEFTPKKLEQPLNAKSVVSTGILVVVWQKNKS